MEMKASDLRHVALAAHDVVVANHDAVQAQCAMIPPCKMLSDFCAHHGVANFMDLPRAQRHELTARLTALKGLVDNYAKVLLRAFNADSVAALSGDDLKEYDAAMGAFMGREDHYP